MMGGMRAVMPMLPVKLPICPLRPHRTIVPMQMNSTSQCTHVSGETFSGGTAGTCPQLIKQKKKKKVAIM